jgi:hypothetical protein
MMAPTMMAAINTQPQMGVLAARHRSMATMTNARDQAFPAPSIHCGYNRLGDRATFDLIDTKGGMAAVIGGQAGAGVNGGLTVAAHYFSFWGTRHCMAQ